MEFSFLLLALSWITVLLQSNILLYLTGGRVLLRVNRLILPTLLLSSSLYLLLYGLDLWVTLPVVVYFIIGVTFNYGVQGNNFVDTFDASLYTDDPEMVAVILDPGVDVVPLKELRAADLLLDHDGLRYSLTYCLLCNTVHAYELPKVGGKYLEISSHGGSVLNGNKVLHDASGRYVWQQFTGEPISGSSEKLRELETKRILANFVQRIYPSARFYRGSRTPLSYYIYSALGRLVRSIPALRISKDRVDGRLPAKMPVAGIALLGKGAKAYPMSIFPPNRVTVLEDRIGDVDFCIVSDGVLVYAYYHTGLRFEEGLLHSDGESWSIDGKAVKADEDLSHLPVTSGAYWYMWSKFHPETEIWAS